MRRRAVVLGFVLLGCGGASAVRPEPAAPAASTPAADSPRRAPSTFDKRLPEVGTVVEDESAMTIEMQMRVSAVDRVLAEIAGRHTKRERRRITVLAVGPDAVTKARVSYLEKTETDEDAEGTKTKKSPLAGKTYVVERRGDVLSAVRDDGTAVPDDELELLRREHRKLGRPSKFASFIPDRAVAPGEELHVSPSVVTEMFGGGGDDVQVQKTTFVFAGPARGGGSFDVEMTIRLAGEPPMDMRVRGRVVARFEDSLPVEVLLEGPIAIDAVSKQSGARFKGTGRMRLHRRASYESPSATARAPNDPRPGVATD